jgi:hypothetical protein
LLLVRWPPAMGGRLDFAASCSSRERAHQNCKGARWAISRPTVGLIGRVRYQTVGLDLVNKSLAEREPQIELLAELLSNCSDLLTKLQFLIYSVNLLYY